jgi:hypothetical protein
VGIKGLALAVLAAASIGATAHAAEPAGARAFAAWLYSHYPARPGAKEFEPLGAQMAAVFHPSLIVQIKEDTRLAGGEVGALDGDPICDCQDDAGSTFTIRSVRETASSRVIVMVARGPDESGGGAEIITLDLAPVDGHWRVYDVGTKDTPSLRTYLIKSNQEARAAK